MAHFTSFLCILRISTRSIRYDPGRICFSKAAVKIRQRPSNFDRCSPLRLHTKDLHPFLLVEYLPEFEDNRGNKAFYLGKKTQAIFRQPLCKTVMWKAMARPMIHGRKSASCHRQRSRQAAKSRLCCSDHNTSFTNDSCDDGQQKSGFGMNWSPANVNEQTCTKRFSFV
jgi:hypothetical protein